MRNSPVLLLIKRGIVLLLVLLVLDRAIGMALEKLFYKQKHGDNFVSLHVLDKASEDILIFGGSRASHHFIATQIEAGTGMSCFNGGRDEMNILYTAAALPVVYAKCSPKIIVLEMLPVELWANKDTKETYERIAGVLLPFEHKYPSLQSTIALSGDDELLKSEISAIYPYNSTIGTSLQNACTHLGHTSIKGYEPMDGAIDTTTYKVPMWKDFAVGPHPLDSNMVAALIRVIKLAKEHNTRLITIISPFYFPTDFKQTSSYIELQKIMADNNCELYDFSHDSRFLKNPALFYDDVHLNDSGAHIFTNTLIDIINKKYIP